MEFKEGEKYCGLGLMSGSSLDGLDVVEVCFELVESKWNFEILQSQTIPLPDLLKSRLRKSPDLSSEELILLDVDYGKWIAKQLNKMTFNAQHPPQFIALHGHTVFHEPKKGYSTQIGSGHHLAALTGITAITDFRQKNIALGGQGAPLVPFGDKYLFSGYDAYLNLGGICNASVIKEDKILAWDISACNQVFNHIAMQLGKAFDKDGVIAISGELKEDLLLDLEDLLYYKEKAPKSLSNQWVKRYFLPIVDRSKHSLADKMHTAMEHIAMRICADLEEQKVEKVLVSGGGVYNNALWQYLNANKKIKFFKPSDQIIKYKEALIFAFLGLYKLYNKDNILSSYSGAKQNCSGGVIFLV